MEEAESAGGVDKKVLDTFLQTAEKNRKAAIDIPYQDPFQIMKMRMELRGIFEPLLEAMYNPSWTTALARHIGQSWHGTLKASNGQFLLIRSMI